MANFNGSGGRFLWKPVSDSTKKCAVHTPAGVRIASLTVAGKTYGVGSIGNGYRPLFRLDKPGSAYGKGIPVQFNLHGGGVMTIIVPDGSKRFEKSGFKDTESAPVLPPAPPAPVKGHAITFPASYAAKVRAVAIIGASGQLCKQDPANPARWTHSKPFGPSSFYAISWESAPAGVKTFNLGPLGIWSYFDGKDFDNWPGKTPAPLPPVVPPVVPPKPPTPPAPGKDATLTATGLRLAPNLVPLVAKVLVLAHADTPVKTVKYQASRAGDEWSTGRPLSAYPAAVFQIFWKVEPPAHIPHHQGFPGSIKNVSHVTQAGTWNPPTTRNP